MIEEYYANPNKPAAYWPYKDKQQQKNDDTAMENGMSFLYNKHQAQKKNLSVEEFVRRDKLVRDAAKGTHALRVGDIVYPHSKAEYEKFGKLTITYVIRSYSEYENEDWNERKVDMVIGANTEMGTMSAIVCTPTYISHKEPV